MRKLVLVAAGALLAAGCGGPAAQPTAGHLAHEIPGCTHIAAQAGSALATGDVTCRPPAAGSPLGRIEVATFATMSAEQQWIQQQPANGTEGCCAEGHLWAADYQFSVISQIPRILRALGGRQVTG
jgi:hypothetical protein